MLALAVAAHSGASQAARTAKQQRQVQTRAAVHHSYQRQLGEWDLGAMGGYAPAAAAAQPAAPSHAARLVTSYQCVNRRPERRVENIMQTDRAFTTPGAPVEYAAAQVEASGALLPVVDDDGYLVGTLTASDCRRPAFTCGEAMRGPIAARSSDTIRSAAALMLEKGLDRLPVVDAAGRCVGLLGRSQLFWALAEDSEAVRPH